MYMTLSWFGHARIFPRSYASRADIEGAGDAVTLRAFIAASSQNMLRTRVVLLATLAAGWTDALCYLSLGRVFASFMTGNLLFVGLSLVQGNAALFVRAALAVLISLAGVTLGSLYLTRLPVRQPAWSWRRTLVRYLLVEGIVLFAFALLWQLAGPLPQQPATQVVLLGIAAFGMGLQGALFGAFNILNVNTIALTGTELLLGIRLAQAIGRQASDQPGGTSALFLFALMLSYTLAALVVALAAASMGVASMGTPFVPFLLVMIAVLMALMPAKRGSQA
jgi:oxalate decarboxylase